MSTIAGNGNSGTTGNGGPATAATIDEPAAISYFPGSADLLITSQSANVVRIVMAATGAIANYAGTTAAGFAGDGGLASHAMLNYPTGLAVLNDGSVLIVDRGNHRIRMVSPNYVISTWMGDGTAASTGDGGFRAAARLNNPWKVSSHPVTGDVFVGELSANRVRRVDGRSGIVSTFIGQPGSGALITLTLGINEPHDLLPLPGSTSMFIFSQSAGARVFLINSASRMAMPIAGTGSFGFNGEGGLATSARFTYAGGNLFHAPSATVLQADRNNWRVRAFTIGGTVSAFAGGGPGPIGDGGPATSATLGGPSGLAWHPLTGDVVIADHGGRRIRAASAGCLPQAFAVSRALTDLSAVHLQSYASAFAFSP